MRRSTKTTLVPLTVMKIAMLSTALAVVASQALPGCDEWCGDVQIPYPFGTRNGCYLNETFSITCNKTDGNKPPKEFLKNTNISVTNISMDGELHILQPIVRDCHKPVAGPFVPNLTNLSVPAMFPIADGKNKFRTIGCDALGLVLGVHNGSDYASGCISMCFNNSIINNGTCSGNGCCQLEIPNGLRDLTLQVITVLNYTRAPNFSSCGYAFVTGDEGFEFSRTDIENFEDEEVEVVLGWAIGKETKNVCGSNNTWNSSFSDDGSEYYRCQCLDGFEGNPYLPQGCQDMDECKDGRRNDCIYKNKCVNTIGNYTCNCPNNFKGDGRHWRHGGHEGEGCIRDSSSLILIIIGVGVGLTVLVVGGIWLYLNYKKWK